ncbi:MAG: methenyltetrahydromethanopterin cyclohydrolase [Planctomycetales bacterium]|nr:methenyltetrahydromethanopterin cyclohydrolase [Planctomycetales bacterium]
MPPYRLMLNHRAATLCDEILSQADQLLVERHVLQCGTTVIDCGVHVAGGQEAGLLLARVCLADLAEVSIDCRGCADWSGDFVSVATDQPVAACMASQYAGWEVKSEKFFAMSSGPMRAAAAREPLFEEIGFQEQPERCVGVLEAAKLPPNEVCLDIAKKCGVEPSQLTLLVAPTHSLAGTIQVVARSVETALHKLHELGFDLSRVVSGRGSAPLPPLVDDDFRAIGLTNDAILYAGEVLLEVRGDDPSLAAMGPKIPSSASADYGRPFAEVLAGYNNDFYQVDPMLFSAARVTLQNCDTGSEFVFGELNFDILRQSFGV